MQRWHSNISEWISVLRHQNDDKATGNHYAVWNLGLYPSKNFENTHINILVPFRFFFPFLSFLLVTTVDWHGRLCKSDSVLLTYYTSSLLLFPFPTSLNLILASFDVWIFWRSASPPLTTTPHPNLSIDVSGFRLSYGDMLPRFWFVSSLS